jgi:hypothetical protein
MPYTKTLIRFDPETKALRVESDIPDPRLVVNVLLQSIATIVNQQPAPERLLIVPAGGPGIVVP